MLPYYFEARFIGFRRSDENVVIRLAIAVDVGRTLPNTDLSRDFMELVVDRLGRADEKEPGIKIGLGLFDLFILPWALFCDCSMR